MLILCATSAETTFTELKPNVTWTLDKAMITTLKNYFVKDASMFLVFECVPSRGPKLCAYRYLLKVLYIELFYFDTTHFCNACHDDF